MLQYTVCVLNFMGKIFVLLVGKKIHGVLILVLALIWCDIDRVRLVKQALQLFPAFNYFIRHFLSIKRMGVAILTQHVMNACQRKLR